MPRISQCSFFPFLQAIKDFDEDCNESVNMRVGKRIHSILVSFIKHCTVARWPWSRPNDSKQAVKNVSREMKKMDFLKTDRKLKTGWELLINLFFLLLGNGLPTFFLHILPPKISQKQCNFDSNTFCHYTSTMAAIFVGNIAVKPCMDLATLSAGPSHQTEFASNLTKFLKLKIIFVF